MRSADHWFVLTAIIFLILNGCTQEKPEDKMKVFAARYTAAWCSQNAASVASFYDNLDFMTQLGLINE